MRFSREKPLVAHDSWISRRSTWRRSVVVAAALGLFASCGTPDPCSGISGTCISAHVTSPSGGPLAVEIDQLRVRVGGLALTRYSPAMPGPALALPVKFAITLANPATTPSPASVSIDGLRAGMVVATSGPVSVSYTMGGSTRADFELRAGSDPDLGSGIVDLGPPDLAPPGDLGAPRQFIAEFLPSMSAATAVWGSSSADVYATIYDVAVPVAHRGPNGTWAAYAALPSQYPPTALGGYDATHLWVAVEKQVFFTSGDGKWTEQKVVETAGSVDRIVAIVARSAAEAYAVSSNGHRLRYDGAQWTVDAVVSAKLAGVACNASGEVVMVGPQGAIYYANQTTAATQVSPGITADFAAVTFLPSSSEYLVVGAANNGTTTFLRGSNTHINTTETAPGGTALAAITARLDDNGAKDVYAAGASVLHSIGDGHWQRLACPITTFPHSAYIARDTGDLFLPSDLPRKGDPGAIIWRYAR